MRKGWIQRARQWLEARQNDNGGWGESCASYIECAIPGRSLWPQNSPATPDYSAAFFVERSLKQVLF
jgi:squalene cyclase